MLQREFAQNRSTFDGNSRPELAAALDPTAVACYLTDRSSWPWPLITPLKTIINERPQADSISLHGRSYGITGWPCPISVR